MSDGLRDASILGIGSCAPDRVLTNEDLEQMVDTSDEWITSRTGIKERRVAPEDVSTGDLAAEAATLALEDAGMDASEIELIIVATVTPDMAFPSTACLLQDRLGAEEAAAFDLEAACSGFLYALSAADSFVRSGMYENVLAIGAETLSKITNWEDRSTCVLMGDGAGAVVVGATDGSRGKTILGTHLGADGSGGDLLKQPAGGSLLPASQETVEQGLHYIHMEGAEVFKFAVRQMGKAAQTVLKQCGLTLDDVDYYVPHQANLRIVESSAKKFGLTMDKVYVNIDKYGNTSAASVPLALDEARKQDEFGSGDIILLVAFGGGLTWGSALLRCE